MLLGLPPRSLDKPTAQNLNLAFVLMNGLAELPVLNLQGNLVNNDVVDGMLELDYLGKEHFRFLLLLECIFEIFTHFILVILNRSLVVHQHPLILDDHLLQLADVSLLPLSVTDAAVPL